MQYSAGNSDNVVGKSCHHFVAALHLVLCVFQALMFNMYKTVWPMKQKCCFWMLEKQVINCSIYKRYAPPMQSSVDVHIFIHQHSSCLSPACLYLLSGLLSFWQTNSTSPDSVRFTSSEISHLLPQLCFPHRYLGSSSLGKWKRIDDPTAAFNF